MTKEVQMTTQIRKITRTVAFGKPGTPVTIDEGLLRNIETKDSVIKTRFSRN